MVIADLFRFTTVMIIAIKMRSALALIVKMPNAANRLSPKIKKWMELVVVGMRSVFQDIVRIRFAVSQVRLAVWRIRIVRRIGTVINIDFIVRPKEVKVLFAIKMNNV
jgi:hypothetical protein